MTTRTPVPHQFRRVLRSLRYVTVIGGRRRRSVLVATAVLVTGCGSDRVTSAATSNSANTTTTASTATANVTTTTVADPAYRSWIATAKDTVRSIPLSTEAGGEPDGRKLSNPNDNDVTTTLLVKTKPVSVNGQAWVEVYLPLRPNGSSAWIPVDLVNISFTDLKVVVSLSAHQLRVEKEGTTFKEYPVGVGTTDTPTPGGVFYIKELLKPRNASGPYGPYAYGLSGFSNVITDNDALGDGVIGIHGTNQPDKVGTDVSHGCIRMKNADITELAGILPLGVPVDIQA